MWAVAIAFIVALISTSWLKGIFGVSQISGAVPLLLAGSVLFAAFKFNRRGGNRDNTLMGAARFGGREERASWKAQATSLLAVRASRAGAPL